MSETFTRDNLIAGYFPQAIENAVIIAGAGALARGAVLGKILKGAASVAAAGAGTAGANTGNGTIVMDATTPLLAGSKPGVYSVRIVKAAVADPAAAAQAHVFDPDGNLIGITDAATSTGTIFARKLKFVIKDGSTAFVAGDGFTITVAAGSGKLKIVNSANVDGSETPYGVLLEAVTAGDSDVNGIVALSGDFNIASLTFGGSDTYAVHKSALRDLNIYGKTVLAG